MRHGDLLAGIAFFEALSDADREDLGSRLVERRFAAADLVVRKGDHGASMFIVLSGALSIFLPADGPGEPVRLKELHSGDYFGEFAIFDDKPRSASVEALTDTVLLELTRDEFTAQLSRTPAVGIAIMSELSNRIRATNDLLTQRATKNALSELEENLSWSQHIADRIAELNGSWRFIFFLIGMTAFWVTLNMPHSPVARFVRPFDDYPFQFFNLALAILVSLQGPLIVMSQNRQSIKDRAQAEADFRVNLKNEIAIERLQVELVALRADSLQRLDVIERHLHAERIRHEVPMKAKRSAG
jgi:CRP/FNR family cyclic AMP-dependent transcriptional regulator